MMEYKYKQYGIYTNDRYAYIVVAFDKHKMFCLRFFIDNEFVGKSNQGINEFLKRRYSIFGKDELDIIDLHTYPNIFKNHGYLGQVDDKTLMEKLDKAIREMILPF